MLDHFRKTVRATFRCWYLHFRGMYVSTSVYLQGEEFIKNRGLSEQGFTNMLTGHETKGQLTDRGQYQLCRLAYEIPAVKELLLGADDIAIVVETLKTSEKCSQWYQQFNAYLSEFGHRLTAAILDVNFPTWCEDPTPVIDNIRSMMPKMAAGWDYDQELGKMHLKRDKVIAQARGQLSEEDRAAFDEQLPNWQKAYAYNEDHWFYLEQVCFSAIRYAALEIGRRLAEANIIEDPQDVFHLTDYEIYEVMESLAEAKGPARYIYSHLLGPLVKHRKELYEKAGNLKEAPFLGNVPETVEDPIAMKVFGLTNFILDKARQETTGKTVKAEEVLEGFPGAPGLVKGKAKVITSHKDFPKVQPDDILVCPYTSPAWTSIFPKVAAVVTDSGGMLTHAAIMAREYGVPAVVGTWVATETIKTGDTIIVDGNKGRVEIVR
ncbi:hypothetical protein AAU61_07580 [Desulfocarbo indianensis]|nr:hypothetical protein AAU61_07580 [Desulfocarbo indianensis]